MMLVSVQAQPSQLDRFFYLVMSVILAGIVVFGFSRTIPGDLAMPGFPALLWLHAGVFGSWVVLFMVQPSLALRGSLSLHRKLGWLGMVLSCGMIVLGGAAVLLALRTGTLPSFYPPAFFFVRGFVGISLFAGLFAVGLATRRQPGWHKRLMLCASIIVVVPGLERALPIPLMGPVWPLVVDATTDVLVLAGPLTDLAVRRRIHPAYLAGGGAIVGGQIMTYLISQSALAPLLLFAVQAR